MRVQVLVIAALLLTPMAWCQKGLEGQSAKNPDLIRALDAASAALANAQREAANGKVEPFKAALDKANLRWSECYGKYREWPTSDTAWRSNFDSINNLLLAAVNAITPGNSLPAAKANIDGAVSTLSSLRSRNGIVDVLGATDSMLSSLDALQATIGGLNTPLTAADVTALQASFSTFRGKYAVFTQAVIDANAFGLGNGELESLQKLIVVQNIGIDSINNILSNPQTPGLVTQWQTLREQIRTMIADLQSKGPSADALQAAASAEQMKNQSDNGQPQQDNGDPNVGAESDRPRLFPRLRR